MAMIQEIRNRSTLLMVVIGVGMLLFIGGDFFSSSKGPFSSNGETDVLIVDGKAVSVDDVPHKFTFILEES